MVPLLTSAPLKRSSTPPDSTVTPLTMPPFVTDMRPPFRMSQSKPDPLLKTLATPPLPMLVADPIPPDSTNSKTPFGASAADDARRV